MDWMEKAFGKNWKTTLGGFLTAFGVALLAVPQIPDKYKWVPGVIGAAGAALLGGTAKDSTTHSTEEQVKTATVEKKAEIKEAIAELKKEPEASK